MRDLLMDKQKLNKLLLEENQEWAKKGGLRSEKSEMQSI